MVGTTTPVSVQCTPILEALETTLVNKYSLYFLLKEFIILRTWLLFINLSIIIIARGNNDKGMRIYPQYTPLQDPCDESSGPAPQYMYGFTSYRNAGDGIFSKMHGEYSNDILISELLTNFNLYVP